jgi:hypothetical protein
MSQHLRDSVSVPPPSPTLRADDIRSEIEIETERLIKRTGKAVSPEPIHLTVYSPQVPNLTLVDMPGMLQVAAMGWACCDSTPRHRLDKGTHRWPAAEHRSGSGRDGQALHQGTPRWLACTLVQVLTRAALQGDNAIILAVSPANADLATSDAIRLAREVDPYFERTIGAVWCLALCA